MSPEKSIFQACLLRFRPIMMTTMAALLGAVPLALGTGTGAELRRPLGITIVGGLLLSQILTLYTTPVIYLYMDKLTHLGKKLRQAGVDFVHRSERPEDVPLPGVLLLDSIGELAGLFERTTVVFMGGTLAQRGGHNILEPAFFGKPVIVGPHMENFAAIIEEFSEAGAVVKIDGPEALASSLEALLENPHLVANRKHPTFTMGQELKVQA